MRLLIAIALATFITGCASVPSQADPNYKLMYDEAQALRAQEAEQMSAFAAMAAHCTGDDCIEKIGLTAALAKANGSRVAQMPAYRKQYHPAWNLVGVLGVPLVNGLVTVNGQNTSRDVSLGQQAMFGGMVRDFANAGARSNEAAFGVLPQLGPRIEVGGDYITGSQHVGDYVGRDQISGHVGDAVGRDQIGGDQRIGDDTIIDIGGDDNSGNSGRINAPGPFDIDTGDRCTGDECQRDGDVLPPPETDPEPDTGG